MCHFVPQSLPDGTVVGSEHDGARLGERKADSPVGHATAGQPAELVVVGDENQPYGTKIDPAQRGPLNRLVGHLGQRNGQIGVTSPTDGGDVPDLGCRRFRRLLQETENQDELERGISPPESTSSTISWQRLPQGLNLLALNPSAQVSRAVSRSPANHWARPNSK